MTEEVEHDRSRKQKLAAITELKCGMRMHKEQGR